ncbi:MAG: dual specificity protein phosphatase family protein [bacterium]|nr:dual specificity protein phosphatase family protein [bacterium]
MLNLYWVRDVAGCNCPSSEADVQALAQLGFKAIVSLTEQPLPGEWVKGFRVIHEPVADFTAPSVAQLDRISEFLLRCVREGQQPVVHCTMGRGRTGTVLAAYLIACGATPEEAMKEVRAARPGAIETPEQEACLTEYYAHVHAT